MAPRKKPGIELRVQSDGTKSYRIRWHQGGGRAGRYLSHTYPTQKLAADGLARIAAAGWVCHCPKHDPDAKPADTNRGPTFGEYAARHAAALTGVGEGYRRDVTRDVRRHLAAFADRRMDEITDLDVREWIRGMEAGTHPWLDRPLSPTTIRRQLAQAGGIMAAAQADGLCTRNPFKGHRLARREVDPRDEQVFLTRAEWELLQQHIPEGVYRDLCTVLVGTGLRWGEVAALAVGFVDVLASPPRLHVARAWKKDGKGGQVLGVPKSSRSRRTVTFPTAVRDALLPHVAGKADDEFVFTTPRGRPLLHSNFYGKVWLPSVRAAQAAGLTKQPRLHDLRHTNVSWLIASGRPIAEISRRVGHQSYNLTADRYGHIMPESDVAALAALEAAMPNRDPQ